MEALIEIFLLCSLRADSLLILVTDDPKWRVNSILLEGRGLLVMIWSSLLLDTVLTADSLMQHLDALFALLGSAATDLALELLLKGSCRWAASWTVFRVRHSVHTTLHQEVIS